MPFKQISEQDLTELAQIVGPENLLRPGDDIEPYTHDEVAELSAQPEAVVRARTTEQISQIMRLASRENFPVTPRGAGQGLSGGSVPIHGGLVLSVERMDKILEIDRENLVVVAEPGVITGNIHRAVEEVGLFYPPDPASSDSCTIGGNVAENAGGPRAVKYGVTRDWVCGLEAVLPSGEVIRTGGRVKKNVTGYDLTHLLIGSEGTLAVVTNIILKLIPLPAERIDLLVPFDNFLDAAKTVTEIISARILPVALEFMERDSLLAVEKLLEREVPFRGAAAHLLITLDGSDSAVIEKDTERIGEICMNHNALDVLVADTEATRVRLWEARKLIIEALKGLSPDRIMDTQDVVVPRSQLPTLLEGIRKVAEEYGMKIISFGHSGDGNVHVNVIKDMAQDEWKEKDPKAAEAIYRLAVDLGGVVTGEHGIGVTRRKYLALGLDQAQIRLMRQIKDDFDPQGILNPGKIFGDAE